MRALHQFHALADRRVFRYAVEVAYLVDGHAEGDPDVGFELEGSPCVKANQMIELGLTPQAAEDDFRGQAGIPRIEPRGLPEQQVRRVTSGVHAPKDVECHRPGR